MFKECLKGTSNQSIIQSNIQAKYEIGMMIRPKRSLANLVAIVVYTTTIYNNTVEAG